MKRIENMLRREIGLDSASVGTSLIERTVRLRMKAHGLAKIEEYHQLLETSRDELEELIEAVVVSETWFYRDREAFIVFANLVRDDWLPQNPAKTLRVLSVPCSTGEEPYSLAMTLLDAGLPRNRFAIDAVDLSARALERAQHAVYGKNSFRGKALEFRGCYFFETKDGYALRREICECVQFHRGNLLEGEFFTNRAGYDFIFCRNLLIYFDRATQSQAFKQLHGLLSPRGVLFVGPAELPLVSGTGFSSANIPMSFACRKAGLREKEQRSKGAKEQIPVSPFPSAPLPTAPVRPPPAPAPAAAHLGLAEELTAARALADAGKLDAAAALCESHLRSRGPSAQVFYLLGLVRDAAGDPVAIDYYRKALYLEPNHYESLLQLALMLEKSGAAEEARTLKRRAQRLQQKRGEM